MTTVHDLRLMELQSVGYRTTMYPEFLREAQMRFRTTHLFLFLLFFSVPTPSWTFAFQGTPVFQVAPTSIDFGPALTSQCCPSEFVTVTNTGNADLTLSNISLIGDFTLGSNPTIPPVINALVPPGQSSGIPMM